MKAAALAIGLESPERKAMGWGVGELGQERKNQTMRNRIIMADVGIAEPGARP